MQRFVLSLTILFLVITSCAGPAPDVLAIYDGGVITVGDLDGFVRTLPEAGRTAPQGSRPDEWQRELLRQLGVQRVLAESEAVHSRLADAEFDLGRRLAIASRLAAAVTAELAATAVASDEAIAAWRQRLNVEPQSREPLSSFRHVFLRLDQATGPAERTLVTRRAEEVARRARSGEDFAALAREYSQSANAADGGMVENARPGMLEEKAREVLAGLDEGEISPVVETRTGLHIFKLERRIVPAAGGRQQDSETTAREYATREALGTARRTLVDELRQSLPLAVDAFPWQVGEWTLSEDQVEQAFAGLGGDGESQRRWLVEQFLLAEEGRRRGFLTPELEAAVEEGLHAAAAQEIYQQRRAAFLAGLADDRLRQLYDAQPSRFAAPELAHLELIFVPQGRDSFATQLRLEERVAELRAGASFAEAAREISTGPAAAEGGDLGSLAPPEWARLGGEIYRWVVAAETGDISDPIYLTDRIVTRDPRTLLGGFAVLRVRERIPPRQRSFEEAVDDVRAEYARQDAREIDRQVRAAMLEESSFEIVRLATADEFLDESPTG